MFRMDDYWDEQEAPELDEIEVEIEEPAEHVYDEWDDGDDRYSASQDDSLEDQD